MYLINLLISVSQRQRLAARFILLQSAVLTIQSDAHLP